MLPLWTTLLGNSDVASDRLTEVVNDQPSPSFLFNILTLSGVEVKKINRVFELPERGFLTPAEMVKLLDYIWWEIVTIQIGSQILENTIGNFNTEDAQRQRKEGIARIKEIALGCIGNRSVFIPVCQDLLGLQVSKDGFQIQIIEFNIREVIR